MQTSEQSRHTVVRVVSLALLGGNLVMWEVVREMHYSRQLLLQPLDDHLPNQVISYGLVGLYFSLLVGPILAGKYFSKLNYLWLLSFVGVYVYMLTVGH